MKILFLLIIFLSCDDIGSNYDWRENFENSYYRIFGTLGYDYGWNATYSPFDNGTIIIGSQQPEIDGERKLWAIKTNDNGFVSWEKPFGGNANSEGLDVISTSDGGFLFVGYSWSFGNEQQVYAVKTDFHGQIIWEKNYGGSMWEVGSAVIELKEGGYGILGHSNSPGISSGNTDIFLLKIDVNGNLIWQKAYGNKDFPNHEWGNDFVQQDDESFLIVATIDRYSKGSKNALIIKTDKNGNKLWEKELIDLSDINETSYSISTNKNNQVYIVTAINSTSEVNSYNPRVIKMDTAGNIQWQKKFNSNSFDYHNFNLHVTDDDELLLVGSTINQISNKTNSDIFLLKIDSNGNLLNSQAFGTDDHDDWGSSIFEKPNGEIILLGSTKSYNSSLFDIILYGIK